MADNILDPNPFGKPGLAPKGDADAKETFTAVGVALSSWEHCETAFGTIYAALVKPVGGTHLVLRAYGTILAANTRREMIQAAAETYFATFGIDSLEDSLKTLLNLYQNGAARRNEIAHGVVHSEPETPHRPPSYFLFPSLFSSRKQEIFHLGPKYRFSSREIYHYGECFDALASRGLKFQQSLRKIYSSLPEELLEQYP